MERDIFICNCNSLEHQLDFWYDDEYKEVYCEVHLTTYKNFFHRLWAGLKYAFGHKSRFGNWDEFIFKDEDAKKLQAFLNNNN